MGVLTDSQSALTQGWGGELMETPSQPLACGNVQKPRLYFEKYDTQEAWTLPLGIQKQQGGNKEMHEASETKKERPLLKPTVMGRHIRA